MKDNEILKKLTEVFSNVGQSGINVPDEVTIVLTLIFFVGVMGRISYYIYRD
jgi:hypothetical protein